MGEACITHGTDEKCLQNLRQSKGKRLLGKPRYERRVLKCILQEEGERVEISGSQSLSDRNPVNSFFYKMRDQYN